MTYTPYLLPPLLAAAVMFILAASGFRSRHVPGALPFGLSMLLAGLWALSFALELASRELSGKLFWHATRFPAIACLPVALFWMSIEHTGRGAWLTPARAAALLVLPAISSVVALTMGHHTLFRYDFRIADVGPLDVMLFRVGPWYPVFAAYTYGLFAAVVALLAVSIRDAPPVYRWRTRVLLAGLLVPAVPNFLFEMGVVLVRGYNVAPSVMAPAGLLLAWGVFRLRLLELVPIARTTVVDTMEDLVLVLGARGIVVDLNPAAQEVMRLALREVVGQPAEVVFQTWPELCECLRGAVSNHDEVSLHDETGTLTYQMTISPIKGGRRDALGRVVVLHNVTELKRAQQEAESATRAKSAFLASISHEIRTPMNVILGFAQLVGRDPTLSPTQREGLDLIRGSGEHLLALLNDTLDLSKIEAGRMTLDPVATDIHTLLGSVEQLFRRQVEAKGLSFHVTCDPGIPRHVRVDARRLRQILINLLSNAVKFTPTGSVTLRATSPPGGKTALTQVVRFAVEDTGVGIAPGELTALFQPFSQAAGGRAVQEGTGLGLALSRQLARLMGGDVQARSELGAGSTFVFDVRVTVLPEDAFKPPPVLAERGVVGMAPGQPRRRILVVDDHAPNRRLLVSQLATLNTTVPGPPVLDVREAATAQGAIAEWEAWRPQLIFLDNRLPDGSGPEVAGEIRRNSSGGEPLSIVGLSASVLEEDRAAFFAAGCVAFIGKPYDEREILDSLVCHLGVQLVYEDGRPAA